MEAFTKGVGTVIIIFVVIAVISLLGGTIVWLAWDGLLAMFPGAVEANVLVGDLGWWDAVKATFVITTLLKASGSSSSSSS